MRENTPFCDIRIDKEGIWYYRGAEMFRREIVNFFYEHLKLDSSGAYLIELPGDHGDRCYVEVEDTPFVIKSVCGPLPADDGTEQLRLLLSDDTEEDLVLNTLFVGADDVLYCTVKQGRFRARFTRASYYQLAGCINFDEEKDAFFIKMNHQRFYIQN